MSANVVTKGSLNLDITAEKDSDDSATTCGVQFCSRKRWKIGPLQRFATPRWALVFISISHLLDEAVANGLFGVTLSSVEKQFQIRSTESGFIGSMMDVGASLTVLVSAYYGDKMFKTRWIGISIFTAGIGCFVYAMPQFISAPHVLTEEAINLCGNVTQTDCSTSSLRSYRFVLMFGMLLCGMGIEYSPTLGMSYLDENVKQVYSSTYNGILYGVGGLGPLIGYVLGAASLQLFTNPWENAPTDADSSVWVGAWWIGFLIVGSAMIIASVPVYLLPKTLPNTEQVRVNREQNAAQQNPEKKGLTQRLRNLLRNPIFIFVSLWVLMYECLIYAFATYAVKLAVELLGLEESVAGFLLGGIGIFISVLGYFVGGIIVTKFNFKLRGIICFVFCCNLISVVFVFGFLLPCTKKEFSGVTSSDVAENRSVINPCNSECECNMELFFPVCDDDGVAYFSPCHAGCKIKENKTTFSSCACVGVNTTSVSSDKCPSSICRNVYAIFVIMIICLFFGYITAAPSVQATIRSVSFEERTMALSLQVTFISKLVWKLEYLVVLRCPS